ncbi:aspartate aminotransferase family protein [Bacillus testis]|uniref:aspartate aminotransferase family protein n=1 Tax=Bacillus testis TaxID=1622072 RepID=UPI00067F16B9|nr:aspartate aminotransferase family protein [Bacillus testis]
MSDSSLIKPALDGTYTKIDYGKGVYLYDENGKKYLDASSGAVTVNIGHGVESIRQAVDEQMQKVSFVYRSQFTSGPAEALADKIAEMTAEGLRYSFFVNSGSEATETAMKIALQYWQERGKPKKTKIISRWMSYHGITMGALSMSGHSFRRDRFVQLLESYPSVNPPYCYRCPLGKEYPSCKVSCADDLQSMIHKIGKENIAAFICEPVIGAAGGAIPSPRGYLRKIKEICDENDILYISDEVMTGVGRTGRMLGCDYEDVVPDIVALGKGMSGGYTPIAAAVVHEQIVECIKQGSASIMSGHTFSANPLSCAASLAVLNYLEKEKLIPQVQGKKEHLIEKLVQLQQKYPWMGDIRGEGLLIGVELVHEAQSKRPFPRDWNVTNTLISMAQENGLLLYPAQAGIDGMLGDAFIISPPLSITIAELDDLMGRLEGTLERLSLYLQDQSGKE